MSHPQTSSTNSSLVHLHCPAPRRPIALVRKQHQLHHHHHHHPYTFRSNTSSDYSISSSRDSNNGSGGNGNGSISRGSLRRSTSPILSKSRRGSAVSQSSILVRNEGIGLSHKDENEHIINFSKEVSNGLVGRESNNPPLTIEANASAPSTSSTSSTSSINASTFDKDRTPTRKEMASISNSHSTSGISPKNLTPTGNHNRIDLQVQKPSPISIGKGDFIHHSNNDHENAIDSSEISSTRSFMESPSSLKSASPSLSIDHANDYESNNQFHSSNGHHHHHSNSNSSSIFSSSSYSSSPNHLSPYLNSTSSFSSSSNSRSSTNPISNVGVPIIPPSPISRNQTRNPFARHFSRTLDSIPPTQQLSQTNDSSWSNLALDSSLPSPSGKRALFLEQQEEEEELTNFNINRSSDIGFGVAHDDAAALGDFSTATTTTTTTTRKHLGGNRHKLSKSEEIKDGLSGLALGLEGEVDGDEIMKE